MTINSGKTNEKTVERIGRALRCLLAQAPDAMILVPTAGAQGVAHLDPAVQAATYALAEQHPNAEWGWLGIDIPLIAIPLASAIKVMGHDRLVLEACALAALNVEDEPIV